MSPLNEVFRYKRPTIRVIVANIRDVEKKVHNSLQLLDRDELYKGSLLLLDHESVVTC
jgi:hypothetical protein